MLYIRVQLKDAAYLFTNVFVFAPSLSQIIGLSLYIFLQPLLLLNMDFDIGLMLVISMIIIFYLLLYFLGNLTCQKKVSSSET